MPRPLRIHAPGACYHVTLRGNHQRPIFVEEGDQRLLNHIVARSLEKFGARLHAYCWMTNHIHLLMQVDQQPLGRPMRSIGSEFAKAMQKKLSTTGHFFERRYHASLVETDAYFLQVIRYIHLNPVKARLVDHASAYPWSSHHTYVGARAESWLTTELGLSMFGRDRMHAIAAYREFLEVPEALEWEPVVMREPEATARTPERSADPAPGKKSRPTLLTLDTLIDEACRRFEVERERVGTPIRDRYMARVRAWIAYQAIERQICGMTAVARALGRDESTLRQAIRDHGGEVE